MILRKPFFYVYDFDRLRLQREKIGIIEISHQFELVSYCVVARFPCMVSVKIPGQKKTAMGRSDKIGSPQLPSVFLDLPKIRKNGNIVLFVQDLKREIQGRKWNRIQVSFSGFHIFNAKQRGNHETGSTSGSKS